MIQLKSMLNLFLLESIISTSSTVKNTFSWILHMISLDLRVQMCSSIKWEWSQEPKRSNKFSSVKMSTSKKLSLWRTVLYSSTISRAPLTSSEKCLTAILSSGKSPESWKTPKKTTKTSKPWCLSTMKKSLTFSFTIAVSLTTLWSLGMISLLSVTR